MEIKEGINNKVNLNDYYGCNKTCYEKQELLQNTMLGG